MADHGAQVIKVEAVQGGDPTRDAGGKRDGVSVFFANTNRGKKSLALDLKAADGVEAVMRLAATCDVIVESFRPGVAGRLGIAQAGGLLHVQAQAAGRRRQVHLRVVRDRVPLETRGDAEWDVGRARQADRRSNPGHPIFGGSHPGDKRRR